MDEAFPWYIGFDSRETSEFQVCKKSLIRRSTVPLHIQGVRREALEWPGDERGIYRRKFFRSARDSGVQWIDEIDQKPFSTEFSFTRFLVPILQQYEGWAGFQDGDMVWQADIKELLDLRDDRFAVMVVKHLHVPTEQVKMDGREQTNYYRKNWSSLILWNCGHPANRGVTLQTVNSEPGSFLHGFKWLADDEIGELPLEWNYLVGVDACEIRSDWCGTPKLLHFTLGTPEMPGYEDCEFSDKYWFEKHRPNEEYVKTITVPDVSCPKCGRADYKIRGYCKSCDAP